MGNRDRKLNAESEGERRMHARKFTVRIYVKVYVAGLGECLSD